ncbi:hypothetical protein V502_03157 [Pseudogymnoascus sp. VKM F-4520 (FW-2644)]|nr:hypothetical protein V502_03157 [Pseudogymnoascus sp. VKM F-4520 (FW-2644)]
MASQTDQFKAAKQEMQRAFEKVEEEEKRQIKETDEAKELTKDDEPEFRPLYVLTEAQQSAMQTVRDKIGAFQEWKEEKEKNAAGEDCDEDEGFDDGEEVEVEEGVEWAGKEVNEGFEDEMSEETKWMQQIQREVLQFCMTLLDHPLQDNEYQTAIISGLAVLMMKGNKGWHNAEDFTTKYSAVIKLAQLMVVQEVYKQRQEQVHVYQSEMTEVKARNKATSYYQLVKQFVAQFTTMAHGSCNPVPMQWIYQTRFTCVQMLQLQSMVHGLIGEVQNELFGKLMVVTDEGGVPSIDWDNTVDQLLETKRTGWWVWWPSTIRGTAAVATLRSSIDIYPEKLGSCWCIICGWYLLFWKKIQFQITGKVVSSAFLWGDAKKKEHCKWTGPEREGGMKKGKGKKGGGGGKEKTQGEEKGQQTKSAWTSKQVQKIMQDASVQWMGSQKWDPDENWDEDNVAGNDLWNLQARHGMHIAGMIYTRLAVEEVADSRHPAGIGRNVQGWHTVLWVAEACVGGHHEAQEPHISRDGDWSGEVNVVPDSSKEHVIWDNDCHHAVGVVAGLYGRAVLAGWDFVYKVG